MRKMIKKIIFALDYESIILISNNILKFIYWFEEIIVD